ncbi:predicted protein [Chaetoceros tenuissimus]|uniref:Uncharacterized protein n=1 Tax=Chaetoceros tenuissimus TaxID=426638 RepID=A0AAD3CIZ2_9STRA|nr:predicted protein [Chaetoceros tenuissimus]
MGIFLKSVPVRSRKEIRARRYKDEEYTVADFVAELVEEAEVHKTEIKKRSYQLGEQVIKTFYEVQEGLNRKQSLREEREKIHSQHEVLKSRGKRRYFTKVQLGPKSSTRSIKSYEDTPDTSDEVSEKAYYIHYSLLDEKLHLWCFRG